MRLRPLLLHTPPTTPKREKEKIWVRRQGWSSSAGLAPAPNCLPATKMRRAAEDAPGEAGRRIALQRAEEGGAARRPYEKGGGVYANHPAPSQPLWRAALSAAQPRLANRWRYAEMAL